jgi:hypothetical protein
MANEKQHVGAKGGNIYVETYSAWEKMVSEHMDNLFRSPVFLASMGKVLENSLTMKEQLDKGVQAYLQAMGLPSTKDIGRVLEALADLRGDVEDLRAKVDQLMKKPLDSEPNAVSE